MRIGLIADCHLGYTSGKLLYKDTLVNLREQDGYNAFNTVIDGMIQEKVDCVVICGDLFHTPNPSPKTVTVAQEGFNRLSDHNIPVYNLAGNHDATDNINDIPANRILHQPRLKVYSEISPYITYEIGEDIVLHLISHHGYIFQNDTMKKVHPVKDKINILCTHGSCYDSNLKSVLRTDGSPREVIISEEVLDLDWDYIWLGHIHSRGWVGSEDGLTDTLNKKRFYAGSLIRRGFSDKECKLGRGFTIWNVSKKSITPQFFTIPQRTQIDIEIDCKDKNKTDIESVLEGFFSELDVTENPIVRLNLLDIDKVVRNNIEFSQWNHKIQECLSFITKAQTKEEIKQTISNTDFSFSLIDSFLHFWENTKENYKNTNSEEIHNICIQTLKDSEIEVLED